MELTKPIFTISLIILTAFHFGIPLKADIYRLNNVDNPIMENDSLLFIKSQNLSKNYEFDTAIEILEKLVHTDSLNLSAIKELEILYHKTGQHNAAIRLGDYLINQKVDINYYAIRKAISLKKIGQYKQSIEIFLKSYSKDSTNSFMTTQIGDLFRLLQKPADAVQFYTKTCKIKPSSTVIIKTMDLLLKAKKKKEALQFFNDYYKVEFANNNLLSRLYGKTLYVNEKYSLAKKTFSRLYESGDSCLVTTKYLGMCMWKLEEYHKGIPVLEQFIKTDSTDYQAFYMLGSCYVKCKQNYRPDKGEGYLKDALGLIKPDPKTLNLIYNDLAIFYQRKRNIEKELEIYEIMKENVPTSRYVDYKMATLYDYGFNNKKEALDRYKELLALYQADTNNRKKSDIETFCENRIKELNEEEFWLKSNEGNEL